METTYANVPPPEEIFVGVSIGNPTGAKYFYKEVQEVLKNMELDEDAIANTLVLTMQLGGISSKSNKFEEYLDVTTKEFVGYWCEKTGLNEGQFEIVQSVLESDDLPLTSQQSFSLVPVKETVTTFEWVLAFLEFLDQETRDALGKSESKQLDEYQYNTLCQLMMDDFAGILAASEALRELTERKYVVAGNAYSDPSLIHWRTLVDSEFAKTEEASE
tara:strand:- start:283 stop:933 length:651 start_codon:yes stop_codon:yes gene_type:complete